MEPGPRNLITDVEGLVVGNAQDFDLKSGVTVLSAQAPFVAGVHVMGGAPGTRETDLLAPDKTVTEVDALVLSGGSAFGLAAATGVVDELRARGRGFVVGPHRVPIVPAAILFDLMNGGDKAWDREPYTELGTRALAAIGPDFALGTTGAGTGATTANLKGGLGSSSLRLPSGHMVGALVAVNAIGAATMGDGPEFWASHCEIGTEFGGLGAPRFHDPTRPPPTKLDPGSATTIGIVATDARLDKGQATRMAIAAHDGFARALWPSHSPMDGDLIFSAATGARPIMDPVTDPLFLGHCAALCMARAVARGVYAASPAPGDLVPCWSDRFGPNTGTSSNS